MPPDKESVTREKWQPPIIDLSPFLMKEDDGTKMMHNVQKRRDVAEQLRLACEDYGVFSLAGHGIDTSSAVLDAMNKFFALPDDIKSSIPSLHHQGFTRGYIPVFGESGLAQLKELKEAFSYGYPWDSSKEPENPMQGPNLWPSKGEGLGQGWQQTLIDFYFEMVRAAKAVCAALSLALDLEEDHLGHLCQGGETISLMRAFHYLPTSELAARGLQNDPSIAIGSSPHTDWGFLTLILQDGVGGLQLREKGGGGASWIDVPAEKGSIVVNCGDFLSLLSSSLLQKGSSSTTRAPFHSPIHRVILTPQPRTSMVFFFYPNFSTPLPDLQQEEEAAATKRHQQQQHEGGGGGGEGAEKYNTLLDQPPSSSEGGRTAEGLRKAGKVRTFGEHLMKKWAGVKT